MKIYVSAGPDNSATYEATGWHVDDPGRLHIRKASGNVATYNAGRWDSVGETED